MRVAEDIRLGEWWAHKLAPILGTGYATAYFVGEDLLEAAGALVIALIALTAGSAYVSVINDLTDRASDAAAGKPNRSVGRSAGGSAALVAGTIAAGWIPVLLAWSGSPWVLLAYAAPWIAFTAYSVPPLRLKARGAPGAFADAAGAQLFPTVFVVAVVLDGAGEGGHLGWLALTAAWSAGLGVRGAILHQLRDAAADARSGTRTFAALHPVGAGRVGRVVAFPVEVAAFCAMVAVSGSAAAIAAVPIYAAFELLCVRRLGKELVVVGPPGGDYRVAMHDLYVVLFPLAFLVAASMHEPAVLVLLAGHVALFNQPIRRMVREARDVFYVVRRDANPAWVRGARLGSED